MLHCLEAHLKYLPLTDVKQQPHHDLHLQDTLLKFNMTPCGHIAMPFMLHPSLSLCSQYRKKKFQFSHSELFPGKPASP